LLLRCAGHRPRQSVVVSLSTRVSVSTGCVCEVCWAQASPRRAGLSVYMCVRFHGLRMSILRRLLRHVCLFLRIYIFLCLQRPERTQVTDCSLAAEVCWARALPGRGGLSVYMCVRFHGLRMSIFLCLPRRGRTQVTDRSPAFALCWGPCVVVSLATCVFVLV
jgi:hypothetical protein